MQTLRVQVAGITTEAIGIRGMELRPVDGQRLPAFSAGAHIDLHLQNGLVRSYSLVNPQDETHRYVVAIQRDAASRGGSAWVHDALEVGSVIEISPPRNHFALVEQASNTVLIAGGIGVTPLVCMAHRLNDLGSPWSLYYSARTRAHAAFLSALQRFGPKVQLNFNLEPGGTVLDLHAIIDSAPADSHFYCCGPAPMLSAYKQATSNRDPRFVHSEYFSADGAVGAGPGVRTDGSFELALARSGQVFEMRRDESILDKLIEAGHDLPYSCMEGVCGSCETTVLDGVPDHRDLVLSNADRIAGRTMMICCSSARSDRLVLDL